MSTQIHLNAQGTLIVTPTATPLHIKDPHVPQDPIGTPLHQIMKTLYRHTQSTVRQISTGGKTSFSGPIPSGG
jgi:hypothetical protein